MDRTRIAIYTRVSLEDQDIKSDEMKSLSSSLKNQTKLIHNYIQEHDDLSLMKTIEFRDDGYTGKNFERPGFQRMIEEVKAGHIKCVITKDCSRIGRDYIEVGNYVEHVFPFLGVRFISVNDGYDSKDLNGATPGIDFAFKNLVYDLYSKDLSVKVKSAIRTKMEKGQYVSAFGLYGYHKSKNKEVPLVVDEQAASVVKEIFELAVEGNSSQEIAKSLNRRKVLTPAAYRKHKGKLDFWYPKGDVPIWSSAAVVRIIRDERYIGNMVYYKRVKDKHRNTTILNSEDKHIRVDNTHEAIVSTELFNKANESLRKQSAHGDGKRKKPTVLFCQYCGRRLRESRGKDKHYYCYSGRIDGHEKCKSVIIDKEWVEGVILEMIRMKVKVLVEKKENKRNVNSVQYDNISTLMKKMKMLEQENIEDYKRFREGEIGMALYIQAKQKCQSCISNIMMDIVDIEKKNKNNQPEIVTIKEQKQFKKISELNNYDVNLVAELVKKVVVIDGKKLDVRWGYKEQLFI